MAQRKILRGTKCHLSTDCTALYKISLETWPNFSNNCPYIYYNSNNFVGLLAFGGFRKNTGLPTKIGLATYNPGHKTNHNGNTDSLYWNFISL